MRFADVRDLVFHGGHLPDRALINVCMTGERPAHLDRCDLCAERAIELGRWLDDVRAVGEADVDAVFPAERLAAQQAQIMRRLEQLDQPARVIAFPRHLRPDGPADHSHRVAPAWIAVAAAAGLVLGIVGSQLSSHFFPTKPASTVTAQVLTPTTGPVDSQTAAELARFDQEESDRPYVASLEPLDQNTPRALSENQPGSVIPASLTTGGRR